MLARSGHPRGTTTAWLVTVDVGRTGRLFSGVPVTHRERKTPPVLVANHPGVGDRAGNAAGPVGALAGYEQQFARAYLPEVWVGGRVHKQLGKIRRGLDGRQHLVNRDAVAALVAA
jgi:hypothetical protein